MFRNDGKGRFRDATDSVVARRPPTSAKTTTWRRFSTLIPTVMPTSWSARSVDPIACLINDGRGRLQVRLDVFDGPPTPGTLGLALADLDADGRMDVVQGQGEHPKAIDERVLSGRGVAPDTAPPSITMVGARR